MKEERKIAVSEGTGMAGELIILETNAPEEILRELEKHSCQVYLEGGEEYVSAWAEEIKKKGFTFTFIDSHGHVTPYGTSRNWLEENYPKITEHYVIEDQPEIGVKKPENKCLECREFYTCDNMGTYEECLPEYKYFVPDLDDM